MNANNSVGLRNSNFIIKNYGPFDYNYCIAYLYSSCARKFINGPPDLVTQDRNSLIIGRNGLQPIAK